MKIPRKSKIPNLLYALFINGNLISCLIITLLFIYTVWDIFEAIVDKASFGRKPADNLKND
jgi:hypothetical protein